MTKSSFKDLLGSSAFVQDLRSDRPSRDVAAQWGVGKSSVNDWRKANVDADVVTDYSVEEKSDGSRTVQAVRTRPITMDDAREWLRSSGDDPELFDISIRSIAYGGDMFSNRMSATPKKGVKAGVTITAEDYAAASKYIEGFTYVPLKKDHLSGTAIIVPADTQLGKVDFNGGSDSTIERALTSYANAAEFIKEYRPREVVLAHAGDSLENVCNTSSQRDTNDLDLPHQILAVYKLELEGVRMLAPVSPVLHSAWVPSNHGRARASLKNDMGSPHADYGIANAKMIAHTLESFQGFDNVSVHLPITEWHESLTVPTDALNVGLVHGHQANGADKLGEWWARQDHGRQPTWDADVLVAGHWHSYRAYQSGDARWVFVGPANEPGSSWFTNLKGETSTTGMLGLVFDSPQVWKTQAIL